MSRPKGSTNKITKDVKERLRDLIDDVVNSIDVDSMDTTQKLKLLQLSLHYVIPKLRSINNTNDDQDDEEYFYSDSYCFVEWPEKTFGLLQTNVAVYIEMEQKKRIIKVISYD